MCVAADDEHEILQTVEHIGDCIRNTLPGLRQSLSAEINAFAQQSAERRILDDQMQNDRRAMIISADRSLAHIASIKQNQEKSAKIIQQLLRQIKLMRTESTELYNFFKTIDFYVKLALPVMRAKQWQITQMLEGQPEDEDLRQKCVVLHELNTSIEQVMAAAGQKIERLSKTSLTQ